MSNGQWATATSESSTAGSRQSSALRRLGYFGNDLVGPVAAHGPDGLQAALRVKDCGAKAVIVAGPFCRYRDAKAGGQLADLFRVAREETPVIRVVAVLARIRAQQ